MGVFIYLLLLGSTKSRTLEQKSRFWWKSLCSVILPSNKTSVVFSLASHSQGYNIARVKSDQEPFILHVPRLHTILIEKLNRGSTCT